MPVFRLELHAIGHGCVCVCVCVGASLCDLAGNGGPHKKRGMKKWCPCTRALMCTRSTDRNPDSFVSCSSAPTGDDTKTPFSRADEGKRFSAPYRLCADGRVVLAVLKNKLYVRRGVLARLAPPPKPTPIFDFATAW